MKPPGPGTSTREDYRWSGGGVVPGTGGGSSVKPLPRPPVPVPGTSVGSRCLTRPMDVTNSGVRGVRVSIVRGSSKNL